MNTIGRTYLRRKNSAFKVLITIVGASISNIAHAATDHSYIHCDAADQDIRISELNHGVTQFSDAHQTYRSICRDCNITEWGDVIRMNDGTKTTIRIDRVSGDVSVRRNAPMSDASPFAVRSFGGICEKGNRIISNQSASPAPSVRRARSPAPVEPVRKF
jgi:hypothetical protein